MKAPAVWKQARSLVLLGIALTLRANAQTGTAPEAMPAAAPEIAAIDAQLQRGEWEAARADALARVEAERADPAPQGLARAVARLALAEAGLGRQEDALWHWNEAQNLDRVALSPAELASFGAAGALLAQRPLRRLDEGTAGLKVYRADNDTVQPPRRTAGELPKISDMGDRVLRIQGIVDVEGWFLEPVVLGEGSPDAIYRVLEALRKWRYAPARRNLRRVASFRSVYVGAVGGEPTAEPPIRLGHTPAPGPGPYSNTPPAPTIPKYNPKFSPPGPPPP